MSRASPEWYQFRNAVLQTDFSAAATLLLDHSTLLNDRNGIGETVLHYLAVEDFLSGIEWLHAQGASLNSKNKFGTPLLFEVAQLGYRDLFLWLLAHGADLNQPDSLGRGIREFLAQFNQQAMIGFIDSQNAPKSERPK